MNRFHRTTARLSAITNTGPLLVALLVLPSCDLGAIEDDSDLISLAGTTSTCDPSNHGPGIGDRRGHGSALSRESVEEATKLARSAANKDARDTACAEAKEEAARDARPCEQGCVAKDTFQRANGECTYSAPTCEYSTGVYLERPNWEQACNTWRSAHPDETTIMTDQGEWQVDCSGPQQPNLFPYQIECTVTATAVLSDRRCEASRPAPTGGDPVPSGGGGDGGVGSRDGGTGSRDGGSSY